MSEQNGLLCTKCHKDTGCNPDLTGMSYVSAVELVTNWMCVDCLDEAEADHATEPSGRVDCGECPNVTSGCESGKCIKTQAKGGAA